MLRMIAVLGALGTRGMWRFRQPCAAHGGAGLCGGRDLLRALCARAIGHRSAGRCLAVVGCRCESGCYDRSRRPRAGAVLVFMRTQRNRSGRSGRGHARGRPARDPRRPRRTGRVVANRGQVARDQPVMDVLAEQRLVAGAGLVSAGERPGPDELPDLSASSMAGGWWRRRGRPGPGPLSMAQAVGVAAPVCCDCRGGAGPGGHARPVAAHPGGRAAGPGSRCGVRHPQGPRARRWRNPPADRAGHPRGAAVATPTCAAPRSASSRRKSSACSPCITSSAGSQLLSAWRGSVPRPAPSRRRGWRAPPPGGRRSSARAPPRSGNSPAPARP